MFMWMMIMYTTLALTGASLVYLSDRVSRFAFVRALMKNSRNKQVAIGAVIVFMLFAVIGLLINFMNAIICAIYFAFAWLICDFVFWCAEKIRGRKFSRYYSGAAAVVLAVAVLVCGWYLDHNVWRTEYNLETPKAAENLKIVMFADSHTGTTFHAGDFALHVAEMQKENPDIAVVVGDFVDDNTTKEDMVATSKALGSLRTKYGVYFVFGNHDNGYESPAVRGYSGEDLVAELEKNGVKVLRDKTVSIGNGYYLTGRCDLSEARAFGGRASMAELVQGLDKDKYIIVADHQPADYDNQAKAEVDLVLSGHTHGGQLLPFNRVGKWIGATDAIYGKERRGKTDFIVTSGISDWAIKFKTGTKSEYVVINVRQK